MSEKVSFEHDIKPTFSKYATCMVTQRNIDISQYNVVKPNADKILRLISKPPQTGVQRMPPTEYLGDPFIKTFEQWIADGKQP